MRRSLVALFGLWAAACTGDGGSPVGDDLLPGGVLGGDLEIVTVSEFELAEDVSIFPADRGDVDRLVMAHQWPDPDGFEARPLIRFSLVGADSFPDDSQIVEASLELHFQAVEEPVDLAVHRVTAAWTEEAATWERRDLGAPWTQVGGDFDPVPLAEFTIAGHGEQDSVSVDSISIPLPIDLVAGWLAADEGNEGVVLIQETPGAQVEFVSRGVGGVNPNGPRVEFVVQLAAPGLPAAEISILPEEDTFLADGGESPAGELIVAGGAEVRRLVLVPDPGRQWLTVVAALADVIPVVAVRPAGRVFPAETSRLQARLRQRGTTLLVAGDWPGSDARLGIEASEWQGLEHGHGHLAGREVVVSVAGRHGKGRTLAWTSDIGPHWLPPEFVAWKGYARLWTQALAWLCGDR